MHFNKMELEDLLTPEQLCELLHVQRTWIYRKVRERSIPHLHLGRYLRLYRPAIEKWVALGQADR